MRLSSLASRNLVTLSPDDSLDTAISLMEEHDVHHLPVLEEGRPVGVVSDRDLLLSVGWTLSGARHVAEHPATENVVAAGGRKQAASSSAADAGNQLVGPANVREVMSTPVITVMQDGTALEAARLMLEHKISCLVLVRKSTAVGIVTKVDLLSYVRDLPSTDRRMEYFREAAERHMRAAVTTVRPKDTVPELAKIMSDKSIHHLPVATDGCLLGMVSDRDIRRAIGKEIVADAIAEASGQMQVWKTCAFEIMQKELKTITRDTRLDAAARIMADEHIGSLPVVEADQLIGILTESDIIKILARVDA